MNRDTHGLGLSRRWPELGHLSALRRIDSLHARIKQYGGQQGSWGIYRVEELIGSVPIRSTNPLTLSPRLLSKLNADCRGRAMILALCTSQFQESL